jgi:leucyl-tRNA synthetase
VAAVGVTKTTTVEPKEIEQWFLRITHYSDALLEGNN